MKSPGASLVARARACAAVVADRGAVVGAASLLDFEAGAGLGLLTAADGLVPVRGPLDDVDDEGVGDEADDGDELDDEEGDELDDEEEVEGDESAEPELRLLESLDGRSGVVRGFVGTGVVFAGFASATGAGSGEGPAVQPNGASTSTTDAATATLPIRATAVGDAPPCNP